MKHPTKILGAVAILVVAGLAMIPVLVNAAKIRPVLEKRLTVALGRSVELGDLSLSIFSRSLVARDLRIADDPAFGASLFLTAKRLRIGVALKPLIFSHQLKLNSFEIESPQINLIRASNGSWNFSSVGPAATTTSAGTPTTSLPSLPISSVDRIAVKDGRVLVGALPAHGEPSVYDHVNLTAHDFSFGAKFQFEFSANLPAGGTINATGHLGPIDRNDVAASPGDAHVIVKNFAPVAAAFLKPDAGLSFLADLELHTSSDGQTLTSNGTIRLQRLKLRRGGRAAPRPVELFYTGTHRLKENTGEIQDAAIRVRDTAIHVKGTYQIAETEAEGALLDLKINGQSLPIDDLQMLMAASAVRLPNRSLLKGGTVSVALSVTGREKSLVIAGPISVDNTRLVGFDIGSKIHGIAALGGVQTGDTTEFKRVRMNVRVTNSGAGVDDIDAVIPAMGEVSGQGTISPDDQLNFNLVVIGVKAKGIGKVGVGVISKLNRQGSNSVPLRVAGTSEDPSITADVGRILHKQTKASSKKKN